MSSRYNPRVFEIRNIPDAKAIILTPEDSTTERRWAVETPYLGRLIHEHLALKERDRVLDFGCGIGRVAKEIIGQSGCSVVGVDASVTMRALAPSYVLSDRFLSCPTSMLGVCSDFHHAISVWTLQHVAELDTTISLIHRHLQSQGKLFVVNMVHRCLPMSDGKWADDRKDVRELLCARFAEVAHGVLDPERTTPATARGAFWGVYQRRV